MSLPFSRLTPLLLVILLLLPILSLAKPTPPATLMKVFVLFLQGEDFVEEDDYAGVARWLSEVDRQYQALRPAIRKDLPSGLSDKFEKSLSALGAANGARQHDRLHNQFRSTHTDFMELLDGYDYRMPPLIFMVQNDLGEAEEALKAGEMDELEDELIEIDQFYAQSLPVLKERGVPDEMVKAFKAELAACEDALQGKKKRELGISIAKLQQLFAAQNRIVNR